MSDLDLRRLERAVAADPKDWQARVALQRAKIRAGLDPGYETCGLSIPWDADHRSDRHTITFAQDDIAVVVSEWSREGDLAEWEGAGVYVLKDGRFAVLEGSCDTTGWCCQDSVDSAVGTDLDALLRAKVSQSARRGLGLALDIDLLSEPEPEPTPKVEPRKAVEDPFDAIFARLRARRRGGAP